MFLMQAQRAAEESGLPRASKLLVAAMQEMYDNISEHSDARTTGILAFRAAPEVFEFVAVDRGIGVLQSLRSSSKYRSLSDHGEALKIALTDGASRFDADNKRGFGFRAIFLALADFYGSLRFRS